MPRLRHFALVVKDLERSADLASRAADVETGEDLEARQHGQDELAREALTGLEQAVDAQSDAPEVTLRLEVQVRRAGAHRVLDQGLRGESVAHVQDPGAGRGRQHARPAPV